jgi:hypothetical protein
LHITYSNFYDVHSHENLLSIALDDLTKEKTEQLTSAKQRKDAELAETRRTSAATMWEHELRALRDKLDEKKDEVGGSGNERDEKPNKPERKPKKKKSPSPEAQEVVEA